MSRMPNNPTPPQPTPPQPDPGKKGPNWSRSQWMLMVWYAIMTLGMLWFWQESVHPVALQTIPYSEFKDDLAKHQVVDCIVSPDEIDGQINTAPAVAAVPTTQKAEVPTTEKEHPATETAKAEAAKPQKFQFRTVRVDDPDLVRDLEAGGAKFTGVRPSFISGSAGTGTAGSKNPTRPFLRARDAAWNRGKARG